MSAIEGDRGRTGYNAQTKTPTQRCGGKSPTQSGEKKRHLFVVFQGVFTLGNVCLQNNPRTEFECVVSLDCICIPFVSVRVSVSLLHRRHCFKVSRL